MRAAIRTIVERHLGERRQLLAILRDIQQQFRSVPDEAITIVAEEMDLPRVHVEGTATFYQYNYRENTSIKNIYINKKTASEI
jgi:NADH:ubiquinone oxidoreductase subunit E